MYKPLDLYPMKRIKAQISCIQEQAWEGIPQNDKHRQYSERPDCPTEVCVSHFIAPFHHLELDPEFQLYCYITYSYHGSWGIAAAVRAGENHSAKLISQYSLSTIQLQENAIDPMEAVYCDGTPEGYLEAVLFQKMLRGFPRMRGLRPDDKHILFGRPKELPERWDVLLEMTDWTPKVKDRVLYFYVYREGCFFEAEPSERASIHLCSCAFNDYLDLARVTCLPSKYPLQLPGRGRYGNGRHCCVFKESSVKVAERQE